MYTGAKVPIEMHIGMEKTGTTSVQRYLQDNRELLLKKYNILFPRSLGINLSANLAAACQKSTNVDDLRKIRNLLTPESVCKYRTTLQEQFSDELSRSSKFKRIVISCEHLSSRLKWIDEVQELKEFLQPFSNDLRIIVYLRQQDKFFISSYSTDVKSGRTSPFEYPSNQRYLETFHYSKLLGRWGSVFGEDSLKIKLFEQSRLKNNDIVEDFCKHLDLPENLTRSGKKENVSFNINTLNFLREFNRMVPRFQNNQLNKNRGNIVAALGELDLPGEMFKGSKDNELFYSQFKEDNRLVASKWFSDDPSVPDDLFSGTVKNSTYNPLQNYDQHQLVEVSACIWQHAQRELIEARKKKPKLQMQLLRLHEQKIHRATSKFLQKLLNK